MHGDVTKAARWLGGSLVASCLVLVVGFHPAVTSRTVTVGRIAPAADPQPSVNTISSAGRCDNTPVVAAGALVRTADPAAGR